MNDNEEKYIDLLDILRHPKKNFSLNNINWENFFNHPNEEQNQLIEGLIETIFAVKYNYQLLKKSCLDLTLIRHIYVDLNNLKEVIDNIAVNPLVQSFEKYYCLFIIDKYLDQRTLLFLQQHYSSITKSKYHKTAPQTYFLSKNLIDENRRYNYYLKNGFPSIIKGINLLDKKIRYARIISSISKQSGISSDYIMENLESVNNYSCNRRSIDKFLKLLEYCIILKDNINKHHHNAIKSLLLYDFLPVLFSYENRYLPDEDSYNKMVELNRKKEPPYYSFREYKIKNLNHLINS